MVEFKLPKLKYELNSLEPYIDKKTMMIHSTKHHKTYCDKLNLEISNLKIKEKDINILLKKSRKISQNLVNNLGGYVNHNLFFEALKKDVKPSKKILTLIEKNFKSFEKFKEKFSEESLKVFGSGWVWLIETNKDKLKIVATKNQDNPLMDKKVKILLGLDVWEHAYYLKYQNLRIDYISAFFNVIDWNVVLKRLNKTK